MADVNRQRVKITSSTARRKDLADEAAAWTDGRFASASWRDAPEAVLTNVASIAVSIRFPKPMLEVLRAFAAREGVGYQVLIKRWLNARIAGEKAKILGQPIVSPRCAPRPDVMKDRPVSDGPHYELQ